MAKRRGSRTKTKSRGKRSRRARIKRGARRVGRRVKKFGKKHSKSIESTITQFLAITIPVQLLSHNQVTKAQGLEQKAKAVVNSVTGSIFNFNIFQDAPKAFFNPSLEGAFNIWTASNVGAVVIGNILKRFKVKGAGKIESAGKKLLIPSVLGGIFGHKNDQPSNGGSPFLSNAGFNTSTQLITTSSSSSNNNPKL